MAGHRIEPARATRRGFLSAAGTMAAGAIAAGVVPAASASVIAPAAAEPGLAPGSAGSALARLMAGNERWVLGELRHPNQTVARRHEVAHHQDPFAVVFSCIDSRVPPEIVFDTGVGDIFVIRTGAQVLDAGLVLGSVEFGPNGYPSARLILVLGHENCGAVIAAIDSLRYGKPAPGHLPAVVTALRPAYELVAGKPGDLVANMVRAQVRLTAGALRADPLLAEQIQRHGLEIFGGVYDLDSGVVTLL